MSSCITWVFTHYVFTFFFATFHIRVLKVTVRFSFGLLGERTTYYQIVNLVLEGHIYMNGIKDIGHLGQLLWKRPDGISMMMFLRTGVWEGMHWSHVWAFSLSNQISLVTCTYHPTLYLPNRTSWLFWLNDSWAFLHFLLCHWVILAILTGGKWFISS